MEVVWLPETPPLTSEVHPEVCFWALNAQRAAPDGSQQEDQSGAADRLSVLNPIFPKIRHHLDSRPKRVGKDDLLAAAAAAWTALRRHRGESSCVCTPERDAKGLAVTIFY